MIALIVFACLGFVWTIILAVILGRFVGGWAASWAAFAAIGDAAVIITSGIGVGRIVEWEMRLREAALASGAAAGELVSYGVPGGASGYGGHSLLGARIFVLPGGPGAYPAPYASAAVYPAGPQFVGGGGPPGAAAAPSPSQPQTAQATQAQMYPAPPAAAAGASHAAAQQEFAGAKAAPPAAT